MWYIGNNHGYFEDSLQEIVPHERTNTQCHASVHPDRDYAPQRHLSCDHSAPPRWTGQATTLGVGRIAGQNTKSTCLPKSYADETQHQTEFRRLAKFCSECENAPETDSLSCSSSPTLQICRVQRDTPGLDAGALAIAPRHAPALLAQLSLFVAIYLAIMGCDHSESHISRPGSHCDSRQPELQNNITKDH
jgi:hypothetical protein